MDPGVVAVIGLCVLLALCKGRLAPGFADIVLLDSELRPALTLVEGEIVYRR